MMKLLYLLRRLLEVPGTDRTADVMDMQYTGRDLKLIKQAANMGCRVTEGVSKPIP